MRKKKPKSGGMPRNKAEREKIIKGFSKIPFFAVFDPKEISFLLSRCERVSYLENQVIFREGDIGEKIYVIYSGKVNIIKEKSGRMLAQLAAGEVFGEMALLDSHSRSASALTMEQTDLYVFDGHQLLENFPHLAAKLWRYLAHVLSERLREANILIDFF